MSIAQHPAIEAYFTNEAGTDIGALNTVFTHDATVLDEGKTIVGIEAISAWRAAAKAKYRYTAEPLDSQENGAKSVIRVRLSGHFPGSPVVVTHTFSVHDGKITALEIR
ncbi:nuclear transport factor 2 family protein [Pseudomonas sp. REP124]|uniref:nuclear transport factor 2 family protein n=1 Tax=Pseudomonas sp. REP124 TaxID=2875731 RepID=UPI001CC94AD5|nr:nuclear transport factor 2 family protein [Pseudomonas sp. REP124]MBZ9783780.1 nuclear transport factor 2 family protein [Pseudomonas sp. REP124]